MFVYYRYGTRLMGRLDQVDGSYIATKFFHINYVPLIPLGTHLVTAEDAKGSTYRSVPGRLSLRSLFVTYARFLAVVGLVATCVAVIASADNPGMDAGSMTVVALFPWLVVATGLWAFFWVGRLTTDHRARRLVFRAATGLPFDPSHLLDETARAVATALYPKVVEGARAHLADGGSYREMPQPERDWATIALAPHVRDPAFVGAAMTLARYSSVLAQNVSERSQWNHAHEALWLKLQQIDATPMAQAVSLHQPNVRTRGLLVGLAVGSALLADIAGFAIHRQHAERMGAVTEQTRNATERMEEAVEGSLGTRRNVPAIQPAPVPTTAPAFVPKAQGRFLVK